MHSSQMQKFQFVHDIEDFYPLRPFVGETFKAFEALKLSKTKQYKNNSNATPEP